MASMRLLRIAIAALLAAALCLAQAPAKKSYVFHGKVVSVNKEAQTLSVANEKIDGWMNAMTMSYKVDNPSVIGQLKPGDQITAKVYDGDYVLHDVKPVTSKSGK